MTQYSLQVSPLKTSDDLKTYNGLLSSIGSNDPFYKIGLVLNSNSEEKHISYFVFSFNGLPKIIMIFIIRNIEISYQSTPYKDVISPYGYSGPLISESTTGDEIALFWKDVDTWYSKNNIITEFIRFSLNNNKRGYSGIVVPTLNNVRGHILDEATQWEKFDKKVRNNYRKAVQYNLSFKVYFQHITSKELKEFYQIYTGTMLRRNAESQFFYPFNYFEEYVNNNSKNCALAMVSLDDLPISTEFLLLSSDTVYSYLGGTDSNYFKTRPNDYLKVNVLNWARKLKFKYYLLGGGRINDDQLYAYKKCFFPKDDDVVFYTGRKILNHEVYDDLVATVKKEIKLNDTLKMDTKDSFFPEYRFFN